MTKRIAPVIENIIGDNGESIPVKNIIAPLDFDAKRRFEELEGIDSMPQDTLGKRMVVLEWCIADPTTRTPKHFGQVADIVGVSRQMAYQWRRDEKFIEKTRSMLRERAFGPEATKLYYTILLDEVTRGKQWAVVLFGKHLLAETGGKPIKKEKIPDFHKRAMKELQVLEGEKSLIDNEVKSG